MAEPQHALTRRLNPNPNLELQLALKGKWLELAAPKSVDIYYMVGSRHALTLRSKGQILTLILGNLHSPGTGLHVDTTKYFFSCQCYYYYY